MRNRVTRLTLLAAAFALVAAACGGGDGDDDTASPAPSTTPATTSAATTTAGATTQAPVTTEAPGGSGATTGDLTLSVDAAFTATEIGRGTKPVLALAPDGTPGVAFLLEAFDGFIAYADAGDGWTPSTVVDGYFYGPIGLSYDPSGVPHIGYHDHQDNTFRDELGDLTVAVRNDSGWGVEAIEDEGHDGWDSTLVIAGDGVVRAAGVDPQQFGRTDGVEYFERGASGWSVTPIGSGPIAYEFNVSLAVDPAGNPALTYYDNNTQELKFAMRDGDAWSIETIDADGDTGRYSSLAFDADGNPHVSYFLLDSRTSGTVRYATNRGGTWETADVDALDDVRTGFTGARRITSLALDAEGSPHVVYSDESVVRYATLEAGSWVVSGVATAGDRALGQLVSFELDGAGTPHIALFEVTSSSPLDGVVAYLTSAS
ncbi:MAG: hypothetical protein ACE5GC_05970 [Acidimicrobiia bacterium]